jgi:SOS-response transcriptional repressor LexA
LFSGTGIGSGIVKIGEAMNAPSAEVFSRKAKRSEEKRFGFWRMNHGRALTLFEAEKFKDAISFVKHSVILSITTRTILQTQSSV